MGSILDQQDALKLFITIPLYRTRQRKVKGNAPVWFAFGPGPAAVLADDVTHISQPDAVALEFMRMAQLKRNAIPLRSCIHPHHDELW